MEKLDEVDNYIMCIKMLVRDGKMQDVLGGIPVLEEVSEIKGETFYWVRDEGDVLNDYLHSELEGLLEARVGFMSMELS